MEGCSMTTKQANNLGRESRYAKKVREGRQLYGPECCAHDRRPRRQEAASVDTDLEIARLLREGVA